MGARSRAPPLGGQERLRVGLSVSWRLHRTGACQGRFPGASLAQSASLDGACGSAKVSIIPVINTFRRQILPGCNLPEGAAFPGWPGVPTVRKSQVWQGCLIDLVFIFK